MEQLFTVAVGETLVGATGCVGDVMAVPVVEPAGAAVSRVAREGERQALTVQRPLCGFCALDMTLDQIRPRELLPQASPRTPQQPVGLSKWGLSRLGMGWDRAGLL